MIETIETYLLKNMTKHVISLSLKPNFNVEGVPGWRVRSEVRRQTLIVNIAPHMQVDLCSDPWNMTLAEVENQTEIKSMLQKGYIRRVIGDKIVEPFEPNVTQKEVEEEVQRVKQSQIETLPAPFVPPGIPNK